jgi:hypothetical protein
MRQAELIIEEYVIKEKVGLLKDGLFKGSLQFKI